MENFEKYMSLLSEVYGVDIAYCEKPDTIGKILEAMDKTYELGKNHSVSGVSEIYVVLEAENNDIVFAYISEDKAIEKRKELVKLDGGDYRVCTMMVHD